MKHLYRTAFRVLLFLLLPAQLMAQQVEPGPLYDKLMPYNFTQLLGADDATQSVIALGRRWVPKARTSSFVIERYSAQLERKDITVLEDVPASWWYRSHVDAGDRVFILFGHKDGEGAYEEHIQAVSLAGKVIGKPVKVGDSRNKADALDPNSFSGMKLTAAGKLIHFFNRYPRTSKARVAFTVLDKDLNVVKEHRFDKAIARTDIEYRDVALDADGNICFLFNERMKGRFGKMHRATVYHETNGETLLAGDSVSHQGGHLFVQADGSLEIITWFTLVTPGSPTYVRQAPLAYLQGIARYRLTDWQTPAKQEMTFLPVVLESKNGYLPEYSAHAIMQRSDGGYYAIAERGGRPDTWNEYHLNPVSDNTTLTGSEFPYRAGPALLLLLTPELEVDEHARFEKKQTDTNGDKVGIGYFLSGNQLTLFYEAAGGQLIQHSVAPRQSYKSNHFLLKSIGLKGTAYFPLRSIASGDNYYFLFEGRQAYGLAKWQ